MNRILVAGIALVISSASYAGLYRWVDDSGEVHFSDKVPVAASKKAHTKLDKHGIARKSIDPEASIRKLQKAEELELIRIEKEKLIQERNKELAKVRKRDEYLLSTYDNKNEINAYFESKIKTIRGNSTVLSAQNKILQEKAKRLESKLAKSEDKAINQTLEKRIIDINQTIEQYEKALIYNDNEIIKLSKTYKIDYQRFTELTD